MRSKPRILPARQRHQAFLHSAEFAPELARIPFKWRGRVIGQALDKMHWSSWSTIYESIAVDYVRNFVERYIPRGANLTADDSDICALAASAAQGVLDELGDIGARRPIKRGQHPTEEPAALRLAIVARHCHKYSVTPPQFDEAEHVIARATCPRWWRRQLRKVHGRAKEAGAISLGIVHYRGEPYASNDSVLERIAQNRRNAAALEAIVMTNGETGQFGKQQEYTLAQLSEKSVSNKHIRRGELMLRIKGFENIAKEVGDPGIFVTWTCPSKYHARIKGRGGKGGAPNKNYQGATPQEANQYLGKVTALARSALARRGLFLYGFRIAEPHHDGCPHWHLLLFVRTNEKFKTPWIHAEDREARNNFAVSRVTRIMKRYAWRADRGETGAFQHRLDVKRIDWSLGSAAGYIAKYVAKNIDGAHVGEHKTLEGYVIQVDAVGDEYLTPSARIETWASRWGIRQFQQWGGAPVTVWRELRRIKAEMVNEAPPVMLRAWNAVQKIEGEKRADWAEYLRAQGGAIVPRKDLVLTLAKDEQSVVGRYGEALRVMPYGVRCAALSGVVFKSTRYTWTPVESRTAGVAVGAVFDFTRTRVNNCTQPAEPAWAKATPAVAEMPFYNPEPWFRSQEFAKIYLYPDEQEQLKAEADFDAELTRTNTVWTRQNTRRNRAQTAQTPQEFSKHGWKQ